MTLPGGGKPERPVRGMLRVPFVRRCALTFSKGRAESAFIVNINVLGAYIAMDELPALADTVTFVFTPPHKDCEVSLQGTVTWLNPRQQHPVHSLPPGFGVKLQPPQGEDRRCIEEVVEDYIARNPHVLH
jgi:Tfp pilus assembly protein PilZ